MKEISTYTKKYNELTQRILKKCYVENKDQNLVFSPFSVLILLAIAADATDGRTRDEILKAIAPEMNMDEVLDLMKEIQSAFTSSRSLSSANAVCVRHDIEKSVNKDYIKNLRDRFSGELFSSKNMVSDVNKWVKKKTDGLIGTVADDSMKETLLCLMNAVAFSADWRKKYEVEDVYKEEFTCSDGIKKKIDFLHSTEHGYIENGDFTGFVKPYKDEEYSFMALLPKAEPEHDLTGVIENCNFTEMFRMNWQKAVRIAMPEFKYSFDQELVELCKEMGIQNVFTDNADFSPLSSKWLKAEKVKHKARIEVDRKGTKAVAFTAMEIVVGAVPDFEPKEVKLTRPFLYAIMHNETGLPVFAGIVNEV